MKRAMLLGGLAVSLGACVYNLDFYVYESGTGTGAKDGGAPGCTPGATASCYDGPAGTEGVGTCKGGTKTCAADGQSWGACEGEVLPQPANCASGMDLHCNGQVPPCNPSVQWAKRFGTSFAVGQAIAADPSGNVVVTGQFSGTIDFGCGAITTPGAGYAFVAKLDTGGNCLWARAFGEGSTPASPKSLAIDASGDLFVTGSYNGTIDFGGGPFTSTGTEVFVVKLDPNGNHRWSKSFGGSPVQVGQGIAVDASGHVVVTGYFTNKIDFGGGSLTSGGCTDAFVADLDADTGSHLWSGGYGGTNCQGGAPTPFAAGQGVAIDASGNVIVTGSFTRTVNFGPTPSTTLTSAGMDDVFVAKLAPDGGHLWSERFGDPNDQYGTALAVDAMQNVILAGYFNGSIGFGGGTLGGPTDAGTDDLYVAKLAPDGGYLWSKSFGNTSTGATVFGLALGASNSVLVTGAFGGTLDFGSGPLTNAAAGPNVFLGELDAQGDQGWGGRYGDGSGAWGMGVASDATGFVLLTGYFTGSMDFGSGTAPLTATSGAKNVFVAKLSL